MSIMDDLFGPVVANDNKPPKRDRAAEKAKALERAPWQDCEYCGEPFKGIPKDGKPLRFCSRACGARYTKQGNTAKNLVTKALKYGHGIKPASYTVYRPLCDCCGARFNAPTLVSRLCSDECRRVDALARMRARSAANDNKPPVTCRECSTTFTRSYGDTRKEFCSKACARRTFKRISRRAERARLRSAWVENVDPTVVFDRDGWICQLCGIDTPRELRGTIESTAPELDHIVPLALGGEHSYANTHCACRLCNGSKGATPLDEWIPMVA